MEACTPSNVKFGLANSTKDLVHHDSSATAPSLGMRAECVCGTLLKLEGESSTMVAGGVGLLVERLPLNVFTRSPRGWW